MQIVDWFGDGSIVVVDMALACCAVESEMAVPEGAPRLDEVPQGAHVVAIVSGTLSDAVAPLVASTIASLRQSAGGDLSVVSFGACACAGGPYWDSYSVTKGVDQLVDVNHYIAGCPPPPHALWAHVEGLRTETRGRDAGALALGGL